jgi:16S rRNA U516 pseudouridylate synthase RsuA-like enzyme
MLESINNKVIYLKRIRIANRNLDWLKKGDWKLIQPPQ